MQGEERRRPSSKALQSHMHTDQHPQQTQQPNDTPKNPTTNAKKIKKTSQKQQATSTPVKNTKKAANETKHRHRTPKKHTAPNPTKAHETQTSTTHPPTSQTQGGKLTNPTTTIRN